MIKYGAALNDVSKTAEGRADAEKVAAAVRRRDETKVETEKIKKKETDRVS